MKRRLITVKDFILLAIIIILASAMLLNFGNGAKDGLYAEVTVDGSTVLSIPLVQDESKEYTLENGIKIKTENAAVRFAESGCRDKICVNSGYLTHSGDVAVCLPYKTVITVKGADSKLDAVAY